MELTKSYLKDLTYHINGAATEVHKSLGPGLIESIYHQCIKHELALRNINFTSEVPVNYKGLEFTADLRYDLFVENYLVVELKAVEEFIPIHEAQLLTYIKLLKVLKGVLINFKVPNLYNDGQKTFVNEHYKILRQ